MNIRGDRLNKQIIAPLAQANELANMPDFNDATKLGSGKEMVERLTNLIAIFENPALDFSKNRERMGEQVSAIAALVGRSFIAVVVKLRSRKWRCDSAIA